jgi:glycosyltransferase involved in cell wall biosynthesis
MSICLIAIARDEGRFIAEWLAHYLALGVDRIFVFDNESTDATGPIVAAAAARFPVTRIAWPSRPGLSPQVTAYNHALATVAAPFEWACFFDCDEFLVVRQDDTIQAFLDRFGADVGAVGVNWLGFGSSGRLERDYGLVTETFRHGAGRGAKNNRHIKTIARVACVERMGVHHCTLTSGRYVYPTGQDLAMPRKPGVAARVEHRFAQLNHYQLKSRADFDEKIRKGRAGKRVDDPTRYRDDPDRFFRLLDNNNRHYDEIDRGRERRLAILEQINDQAGRPFDKAAEAGEPAHALGQGGMTNRLAQLRAALPFLRKR